jgi:hypothetical protein
MSQIVATDTMAASARQAISGDHVAPKIESAARNKLALLAIGLAASFLIGCPCGGLTIWRVFFHRPPTQRVLDQWAEKIEIRQEEAKAKNGNADIDDSESEEQKLFKAVADHRWWMRVPTNAEIEEIVQFMIQTNADYWIFVDCDLKMEMVRNDLHTSSLVDSVGVSYIIPKQLNQFRCLRWLISSRQAKRWDRTDALHALLTQLDSRELKDGPGRPE